MGLSICFILLIQVVNSFLFFNDVTNPEYCTIKSQEWQCFVLGANKTRKRGDGPDNKSYKGLRWYWAEGQVSGMGFDI